MARASNLDIPRDPDIWRMIPPEEKFALLARAQSKGVLASSVAIIVGCTIAVALQMSWVMWAVIICSPFVFQFAAGKAWRTLRPKAMLEYLAARSASRRYAFTAKAKDLTPTVMLKGKLEEIFENEKLQEALEAMVANTKEAEVWVTLFGDAVTMISERYGGADLKFAALLDDKLQVSSRSSDGRDYSSEKELILTVSNKRGEDRRYKLTSQFPAALVVFEKKLLAQKASYLPAFEEQNTAALPEQTAGVDDDKFNSLFSF